MKPAAPECVILADGDVEVEPQPYRVWLTAALDETGDTGAALRTALT
ncbi:hypothetical protein [Nocardia australiensis]|nr:hypothetical protein [Nocardia australiensis]